MNIGTVLVVLVFGLLGAIYVPLPGAGAVIAIAVAAGIITYKMQDLLLWIKKIGSTQDEAENQTPDSEKEQLPSESEDQ